METWMIFAICAVVALAVIVVIAALAMRSKRMRGAKQTTQLRAGFGPEYEKTVGDKGRSSAEKDLLKRQHGAEGRQVRSLAAAEVSQYTERWTAAQAQFVDEPGPALTTAGRLLLEVLEARGYPTVDFETGAKALSVDHPRAVQDYRAAHDVAMSNQRTPATTDDLRAAMMRYHAVFNELMDVSAAVPTVHAA